MIKHFLADAAKTNKPEVVRSLLELIRPEEKREIQEKNDISQMKVTNEESEEFMYDFLVTHHFDGVLRVFAEFEDTWTELHFLAFDGDLDTFMLRASDFENNEEILNARTKDGFAFTPLHLLAREQLYYTGEDFTYTFFSNFLVMQGADVLLKDNCGKIALDYAKAIGDEDRIGKLTERERGFLEINKMTFIEGLEKATAEAREALAEAN